MTEQTDIDSYIIGFAAELAELYEKAGAPSIPTTKADYTLAEAVIANWCVRGDKRKTRQLIAEGIALARAALRSTVEAAPPEQDQVERVARIIEPYANWSGEAFDDAKFQADREAAREKATRIIQSSPVSEAGRSPPPAIQEALRTVDRIVLEQRCERGTPWDIACTTIAQMVREHVAPAIAALGVSPR